ncbi:MAG: hypothetical protein PHE36_06745 [Novosphingobium sp.]|nr:hypothetical protein [Novosphingobium sp.]
MNALAQPDFFAEHAWLVGDAAEAPCLTDGARRLRETRIAAALFRRRWSLMIRWRQEAYVRARSRRCGGVARPLSTPQQRATTDGDIAMRSDLPRHLPVLRDEIALLRAFLAREIDAILFEGHLPS